MEKSGTDALIHRRDKNATGPVGGVLIYDIHRRKVSKYSGNACIFVLCALQ